MAVILKLSKVKQLTTQDLQILNMVKILISNPQLLKILMEMKKVLIEKNMIIFLMAFHKENSKVFIKMTYKIQWKTQYFLERIKSLN